MGSSFFSQRIQQRSKHSPKTRSLAMARFGTARWDWTRQKELIRELVNDKKWLWQMTNAAIDAIDDAATLTTFARQQ
jgi:hypothetical protein